MGLPVALDVPPVAQLTPDVDTERMQTRKLLTYAVLFSYVEAANAGSSPGAGLDSGLASTSSALGQNESSCGYVDLREPGKPMHGAPVFNQTTTEYCWGFAGTQLASAVIQKQNLLSLRYPVRDVTLSPTVTLNTIIPQEPECWEPCHIVNSVLKSQKGCAVPDVEVMDEEDKRIYQPDLAEPVVDSALETRSKEPCERNRTFSVYDIENTLKAVVMANGEIVEKARKLAALHPRRRSEARSAKSPEARIKAFATFLKTRNEQKTLRLAEIYTGTVAPACVDLERTDEPFLGSRPVNQVLQSLQAKRGHGVLCSTFRTEEFDRVSQAQVGLTGCAKLPDSNLSSKEELLRRLNLAFDSGRDYPVGVHYCYSFLYEGEPGSKNGRLCSRKDGNSTTDHKSLLIGRRFNKQTQKCEFLLRNTTGKNCQSLHPKYRTTCEEEMRKNNAPDVWISSDTLKEVVHGINVIEETRSSKGS